MGIDLSKTPLAGKYAAAGVSLQKKNLSGVKAAVYLVADRSGSMRRFYSNQSMQNFAEQVLALAAHFDDDGIVPVVFFDTQAHPAVDVSVTNYAGRMERINASFGAMGTTNYAAAMRTVMKHHRENWTGAPAFVVFQTDGAPNSRAEAEQVLCEASKLPLFWQFVGFGDDEFDFLRKLDNLPVPGKRVVDNAGFFPAGRDPKQLSDSQLYDQLMAEFPNWLTAARNAQILV